MAGAMQVDRENAPSVLCPLDAETGVESFVSPKVTCLEFLLGFQLHGITRISGESSSDLKGQVVQRWQQDHDYLIPQKMEARLRGCCREQEKFAMPSCRVHDPFLFSFESCELPSPIGNGIPG
jgi:hypothetical protein